MGTPALLNLLGSGRNLFKFKWSKKHMITLKAPKGKRNVSWNGSEYKVDKNGFVKVPGEALEDLQAFGYALHDSVTEPNNPPAGNKPEGEEEGEGEQGTKGAEGSNPKGGNQPKAQGAK
jgi:hypothetical protein